MAVNLSSENFFSAQLAHVYGNKTTTQELSGINVQTTAEGADGLGWTAAMMDLFCPYLNLFSNGEYTVSTVSKKVPVVQSNG